MWKFEEAPKELRHHGIKGQKWGERNGPPYPLSRRKHNAVVNRGAGGSEKRKSGSVALAVAAVAVAAISISKMRENTDRKRSEKKDKPYEISDLEALEKRKTLNVNQSLQEVVKNVNPDYNLNEPDTCSNCPYCTLATELRIRGYDVRAKHLSTGDYCEQLFNRTFKTPPPLEWSIDNYFDKRKGEQDIAYEKRRNEELCADIVKKSGPNSRGAIVVSVPFLMSHVLNYVVDAKGKVAFIDGQCGETNSIDVIKNLPENTLFDYVRLDNRAIDKGMLETVRIP